MPSFRLPAVLWAFALLAAAMATFGAWGILAAVGVGLFWAAVRAAQSLTWGELAVAAAIVAVIVALLIPAQQGSGSWGRNSGCLRNLAELASAVLAFADERGALPPAAAPDAEGNPPTSWRLRILPQLGRQDLARRYHADRLWDAPANAATAAQPLSVFECPSDVRASQRSPHTSYFAIVDDRAAWPTRGGRRRDDFPDGADRTILLIEAPGRQASWAEPQDLSFDDALALLTLPPASPSIELVHYRPRHAGFFDKPFAEGQIGVIAAFADGRAGFLPVPLPRDVAVALLTADGGEPLDAAAIDRLVNPQLDYGKCYAFSAFVLLALAPSVRLVRRWRAPKSTADAAAGRR
jgi:hypothetical protein